MNKIISLCAILFGLAGCSSSYDPVADLSTTLTNVLLNGTWASDCFVDAPDSITVIATFSDGNGTTEITYYIGDTTCTNISFIENNL